MFLLSSLSISKTTTEAGYNVMKGTEQSVVIAEECNVTV
jgi:hypothetical protein